MSVATEDVKEILRLHSKGTRVREISNLFSLTVDEVESVLIEHKGTELPLVNAEETDDHVEFRTRDLNQAAFFWLQDGAVIINLEGVEGQSTIYFRFKLPISKEQLTQLQLDYSNGRATVDPLAFAERQNRLKDMLSSTLGRNRRTRSIRGE